MSNFTFKLPNGESFEIKMPSGATFEQAQAVFKQQVDSGGLTGFKVGDALSAATQAEEGLAAAASQAQQGLSSALGKLPSGTDLNSLAAGVGPAAAGAINQVQSALTGAGPAVASLTTGASSAINSAISGITSSLPGAISSAQAALPGAISAAQANLPGELASMQSKLPAAIGALTGQAAQIGSIANNAIKTLSGAISGTPLNGINVADFAKQGPSLGPIGSLDTSMVTGALAQASKLVSQAADGLSNSLGVGKFGFDANQLEKAGFLKPGTAAEFLSAGQAELTTVLKSPLPWTGKDGVKGIGDLLGNGKLQDKIQQGLMSSGLGDLKQLGVPTDKLNPQALAGLATNAAKSVESTVAWAKNAPGLPPEVKAKFDEVASNSAFAVKLTEGKVEPALKQEEPAPAATNTVNSDTVDAASKRIVGNEKVPSVTGTGGNSDARTKTAIYVAFVGSTYADGQAVLIKISNLEQTGVTQELWNQVNQEFIAVKAAYNARIVDVQTAALDAISALGDTPEATFLKEHFEKSNEFTKSALFPLFDQIKQRIADLANRIRR